MPSDDDKMTFEVVSPSYSRNLFSPVVAPVATSSVLREPPPEAARIRFHEVQTTVVEKRIVTQTTTRIVRRQGNQLSFVGDLAETTDDAEPEPAQAPQNEAIAPTGGQSGRSTVGTVVLVLLASSMFVYLFGPASPVPVFRAHFLLFVIFFPISVGVTAAWRLRTV